MRNDYETLLLERREQHVLVVTLNRPQRSNAFNTQMGLELLDLFSAFYVDQEDVRCVILGPGPDLLDVGAWIRFLTDKQSYYCSRNRRKPGVSEDESARISTNYSVVGCERPVDSA